MECMSELVSSFWEMNYLRIPAHWQSVDAVNYQAETASQALRSRLLAMGGASMEYCSKQSACTALHEHTPVEQVRCINRTPLGIGL